MKFNVIVPSLRVALPVAAAVAFARMENPQTYSVTLATAASVVLVAAVVPVALPCEAVQPEQRPERAIGTGTAAEMG